jgi:hypothetical protein
MTSFTVRRGCKRKLFHKLYLISLLPLWLGRTYFDIGLGDCRRIARDHAVFERFVEHFVEFLRIAFLRSRGRQIDGIVSGFSQ